jgi:hypothetical protein
LVWVFRWAEAPIKEAEELEELAHDREREEDEEGPGPKMGARSRNRGLG